MRVLIIGGSGIIGKGVSAAFKALNHEVITAASSSGDYPVDLKDSSSIEKLYKQVGPIDHVISAVGSSIPFHPLLDLKRGHFEKGFQTKLLGQLDLVLIGQHFVNENASFTLTTGILNHSVIPCGSIIATVNNALEGFVKSAAFELPKKMRLNAVSPDLILEAKEKHQKTLVGFRGLPLEQVSQAYVKAAIGLLNGKILKVHEYSID